MLAKNLQSISRRFFLFRQVVATCPNQIMKTDNDSFETIESRPSGPARVWTERLTAGGWAPVSNYFLRNYHRLGITHTEAMLIVHLFSYKWDERSPFPSMPTLAKEMGVSPTQARVHTRSLVKKGFLHREHRSGRPSLLHLNGLLQALHKLIEDEERVEAMKFAAFRPATKRMGEGRPAQPV